MSLASFFLEYKLVLLFYSVIILLIYLNREKFEIQAKIIALYRTKFGIKWMKKVAKKHGELVKILGYTGIGIGFIGMIFITFNIIYSFFKLFLVPKAPAAVGLVLPGVRVPGSSLFIPFWYGIIAIFIVIVIHEFSHGLVASAHNLKIKNTGFGMFAIFPIAFVEPDEKEMQKKSDVVQYSIFAAGPFSNIVSGILFALVIFFVFIPLVGTLSNGITIIDVVNNTPADKTGFYTDLNIVEADDYKIKNTADFQEFAASLAPEDRVTFTSDTGESFDMILEKHPKDNTSAYMGITFSPKIKDGVFYTVSDSILRILIELFNWIFILSLGIGLANLLPLGPVDGGRMFQIASQKITGNEKRGNKIWIKVSKVVVIMLVILILMPILKSVFGF